MDTITMDAEFLAISPAETPPAVLTVLVGTDQLPAQPERYTLTLTPHLTTFGSAAEWRAAIGRCQQLCVQRRTVHLCLVQSAMAPEPVVPVAPYHLARMGYTARAYTIVPGEEGEQGTLFGLEPDEIHAVTLELVRAS